MRPIPDALAQLYPRPAKTVAARPWWHIDTGDCASHRSIIRRVDGWMLDSKPTDMAAGRRVWAGTSDGCVKRAWFHETTDLAVAMAALDREHPLPCPPPRCGQVWHFLGNGCTYILTTVSSGGVYGFGVSNEFSWPPPNALLLHDPFGHPWAPVE